MADSTTAFKAVAFDAYGTLFDVYSICATAERFFPGQGESLAQIWRDKQIEYTRLRTLSDRYLSFWAVTEDALSYACRRLDLPIRPAQREALLAQYRELKAFPENIEALRKLRAMGLGLAILSNADPQMLASAVESAGMSECFDHLLSADAVRRFKTAPEAYQLGPDAFHCAAAEILFVSSNAWDIAGALWFGYTTFWVNRTGLPMEELGGQAHMQGNSLQALVEFAARHRRQSLAG